MSAGRIRLWLSSVCDRSDPEEQPDPSRRLLLTGAAATLACVVAGVGLPTSAEAGERDASAGAAIAEGADATMTDDHETPSPAAASAQTPPLPQARSGFLCVSARNRGALLLVEAVGHL